jgi:leucine dehydrogenase
VSFFDRIDHDGHEAVLLAADPASGYRGIIAIHSTALGIAAGGTRWWRYEDEEAALVDALRLSRGMSYKNALAGIPLGGGKSVIIASPAQRDRRAVLRAHGRAIDSLGGRYVTGEDVGTTVADMDAIAETTAYVAGRAGGAGDLSPATARGIFRAMQAAARFRWGSDDLAGRTVTVQGCGNVGFNLIRLLTGAGARVIAADLDPAKIARAKDEYGVTPTDPAGIVALPADIHSPCALGAVFDDRTIPELRVELVVGGANNQLLEARHGQALAERNILYVPDYVANAGGVTYGVGVELMKQPVEDVLAMVDRIYDTTMLVLERARADGVPPSDAADRLAEGKIRAAKKEKGRA